MVTVPVKELQVGDVLVLKLDPGPMVLFAEIIKLALINQFIDISCEFRYGDEGTLRFRTEPDESFSIRS